MAASITFEEGSRVPSSVDESRPFSSLNRFLSRSISLRLLKPLSSSPPFSVLSACSLRLAALRHSVSRRDSSTARSSGLIRASRAASSSAFSSQKAVRSSSGVLLSLAVTAVSDAASGREEEERELLCCFESRSAPTKASRRGTASATSAVESSASSSGSAARRRLRGAMMMVRCLAFGCSLLFFWFVCVCGWGGGERGGGTMRTLFRVEVGQGRGRFCRSDALSRSRWREKNNKMTRRFRSLQHLERRSLSIN